MAAVLVQLEGHAGHPRSETEALPYIGLVPDATNDPCTTLQRLPRTPTLALGTNQVTWNGMREMLAFAMSP